jgi:hypothetical protein
VAFSMLFRELTRRPFLLNKSAIVKSPRPAESLVRGKVVQSNVQIHAIRILDGTGQLDEEKLPYLRNSVEDCARCDPVWATWATARARERSICRCGPRSIHDAIMDILTQRAEARRDR